MNRNAELRAAILEHATFLIDTGKKLTAAGAKFTLLMSKHDSPNNGISIDMPIAYGSEIGNIYSGLIRQIKALQSMAGALKPDEE